MAGSILMGRAWEGGRKDERKEEGMKGKREGMKATGQKTRKDKGTWKRRTIH